MSHVFISYANTDRGRAKMLAEALIERGWDVWWDRVIPAGRSFDVVIEEAIDAASCVLVLWSRESVSREWVKTEAQEGRERGILVPILIDDVKPPLAFRRIQAADLIGWSGSTDSDQFAALVRDISRIFPPSDSSIAGPHGRQSDGVAPEEQRREDVGLLAGLAADVEEEPERQPAKVDPQDEAIADAVGSLPDSRIASRVPDPKAPPGGDVPAHPEFSRAVEATNQGEGDWGDVVSGDSEPEGEGRSTLSPSVPGLKPTQELDPVVAKPPHGSSKGTGAGGPQALQVGGPSETAGKSRLPVEVPSPGLWNRSLVESLIRTRGRSVGVFAIGLVLAVIAWQGLPFLAEPQVEEAPFLSRVAESRCIDRNGNVDTDPPVSHEPSGSWVTYLCADRNAAARSVMQALSDIISDRGGSTDVILGVGFPAAASIPIGKMWTVEQSALDLCAASAKPEPSVLLETCFILAPAPWPNDYPRPPVPQPRPRR